MSNPVRRAVVLLGLGALITPITPIAHYVTAVALGRSWLDSKG